MKKYSEDPFSMLQAIWRSRGLIKVSVEREISSRYKGSMLGFFWAFLIPLFLLLVYTFVFSTIFKARWSAESGSRVEFALVLFAGLIIFNIFSDCLNKSSGLIVSNQNYVKKVIFPLEILSCVTVLSSVFSACISIFVWIIVYCIFFGAPHLTIFYLPFVIIPFCFFCLGVSWFFSSLGVYLRDTSQIVGIATTVLMFLSPIFYPVEIIPKEIRGYIYLNPLTWVIEVTRDILYWGKTPSLIQFLVYSLLCFLSAWLGYVWFQKTRKGFSDVL